MKKSLPALVVFYRGSSGLTHDQQCRLDSARAIGRPVKIIKTFVAEGGA
ncbi:MAG: hypothetical protein ACXWTT_04255 [Methylobacter sp.]